GRERSTEYVRGACDPQVIRAMPTTDSAFLPCSAVYQSCWMLPIPPDAGSQAARPTPLGYELQYELLPTAFQQSGSTVVLCACRSITRGRACCANAEAGSTSRSASTERRIVHLQ